MSYFVPNEMKKVVPGDLAWITKYLKLMLHKKNVYFKLMKNMVIGSLIKYDLIGLGKHVSSL